MGIIGLLPVARTGKEDILIHILVGIIKVAGEH